MHIYRPYLDWIKTQESILTQRLRKWAHINSFSFHLEGLAELLTVLTQDFHVLGGESQLHTLPPLQMLTAEGKLASRPLGQALSIRKRPHASIQVLLGGHFDTVYPPSSSFQTIDESQPGIWRGPGITDMKGGLAILLTALEALERSPFAERIGWEVLLNPDEEIGSPGSSALFKAVAHRHQVALLFEPALPDGAFVNQRKGSANYTLVVRGRAAHVGRDFAQGRSAVFAIARFIQKLETINKEDLIINVADVEGKGPLNIVPPLATCRINCRSGGSDALDRLSVELEKMTHQFSRDGIIMEVKQDSFRSPKPFDATTQQLFKAYASCAQELSLPFEMRQSGGVCDGNILAGEGLPTLDTAGAVGGELHTPQEYLLLSSLVERAQLTALFLFKLASHENDSPFL